MWLLGGTPHIHIQMDFDGHYLDTLYAFTAQGNHYITFNRLAVASLVVFARHGLFVISHVSAES